MRAGVSLARVGRWRRMASPFSQVLLPIRAHWPRVCQAPKDSRCGQLPRISWVLTVPPLVLRTFLIDKDYQVKDPNGSVLRRPPNKERIQK